jgi:hypothetical protein
MSRNEAVRLTTIPGLSRVDLTVILLMLGAACVMFEQKAYQVFDILLGRRRRDGSG